LKSLEGKTIISVAFDDDTLTNRSVHLVFSDTTKVCLYHDKACSLITLGNYSDLLNVPLHSINASEKPLGDCVVTTFLLCTKTSNVTMSFYSKGPINARITEATT